MPKVPFQPGTVYPERCSEPRGTTDKDISDYEIFRKMNLSQLLKDLRKCLVIIGSNAVVNEFSFVSKGSIQIQMIYEKT